MPPSTEGRRAGPGGGRGRHRGISKRPGLRPAGPLASPVFPDIPPGLAPLLWQGRCPGDATWGARALGPEVLKQRPGSLPVSLSPSAPVTVCLLLCALLDDMPSCTSPAAPSCPCGLSPTSQTPHSQDGMAEETPPPRMLVRSHPSACPQTSKGDSQPDGCPFSSRPGAERLPHLPGQPQVSNSKFFHFPSLVSGDDTPCRPAAVTHPACETCLVPCWCP